MIACLRLFTALCLAALLAACASSAARVLAKTCCAGLSESSGTMARILRGIEANIKNVDGEIDCSGKMFDSLDLIIAGFHEPVFAPHDKATNTQAMIATIASGNVHIISHPGNPKYEIDVKAVAEAAAKHQVALEINNSSFLHSRKGSEDNCREVAAAVRDAGGWVALGSDSHTAFTMGEFEECLKILDAVDFPPERILNVSPRRLLNFLESRGMAPISARASRSLFRVPGMNFCPPKPGIHTTRTQIGRAHV